MRTSALFVLGAAATLVTATLDVGGPHGPAVLPVARLAARDMSDVHRRHHIREKRSSGGSCTHRSSSSNVIAALAAATAPAPAPAPAPAAPTTTADTSSLDSSSSANVSSASLDGITGFLGTPNTGCIGSWFKTDSSSDSTNGRSWCQLNYQDSWMGFAPSVQTMLDNFGGDTTKAGTAYCGLEVKATNPANGNSILMYIVDGFSEEWVRTPCSVDMTVAAFTALEGSFDDNKDTVISNVQWQFTGNVNPAYTFNSGN